jgi:hypothetical protein
MSISELSDALAHVPPFTQVVVLIVSAFALAGYALYVVDRGRR